MYVLVALVVLVLALWKNFGFRQKKISDSKCKPIPAPPSYPVVGNLLTCIKVSRNNRLVLARSFFEKYGPVIRLFGFGMESIHTCSADFAQFILSSNKFINKGYYYNFMMPWLGSGLATSRDENWRKRRKMLHPAFHYSILNDSFNIACRKSDILIKNLEAELNSEWFDVSPYLYSCSLDIIAESAMNINLNTQGGCSKDFYESVQRFTKLAAERVVNIFLQPDILHRFSNNYKKQQECLRILHGLSTNIIQEKMKEKGEQKIEASDSNGTSEKKKSLIEILLTLSDPVTGFLSMDDIRDEVNTFLFAGQDSSATSLTWTLLLIGQHPEVQKKMVQELDEVFGNSNRWPNNDDLAQLKYIECVCLESLRLYPSIAFLNREITEDVVLDGYLIPAGVDFALHIHQLHRSPEHYANPNKFDPSNFYLENVKKRHPYAFVPFSAGPRNCIGGKYAMNNAKIILIQILRNFEIESLYSMEEIVPVLDLMLTRDKEAKIKIRRRIKN